MFPRKRACFSAILALLSAHVFWSVRQQFEARRNVVDEGTLVVRWTRDGMANETTTTTTTVVTRNDIAHVPTDFRNDDRDDVSQKESLTSTRTTPTNVDDAPTLPLLSNRPPGVDNGKPYLILHFGPAKTGTSTIQYEMTRWKDRVLRSDNVLYAGAYYEDGQHLGALPVQRRTLDMRCHQSMTRARKQWEEEETTTIERNGTVSHSDHATDMNEFVPSLQAYMMQHVPCFASIHDLLEGYRANGTSLIFSNEVKSLIREWRVFDEDNHGDPPKVAQLPMDFRTMAQTFFARDWNFLLVVGHRPYLDWIQSAKTQVDKYTPSKPALNRWPGSGGRNIQTLFPAFTLVNPNDSIPEIDTTLEELERKALQERLIPHKDNQLETYWKGITRQFMDSPTLYQKLKDYLPIRILHLHDTNTSSVRSNFLCNLIPNAPNACRASLEADRQSSSEVGHMNAGSQHVDRAWYDQLACAAVKEGFVNASKASRPALVRHMMQQPKGLHNHSVPVMPRICPNKDALRALWDASWHKETILFQDQQANATLHKDLFLETHSDHEVLQRGYQDCIVRSILAKVFRRVQQ